MTDQDANRKIDRQIGIALALSHFALAVVIALAYLSASPTGGRELYWVPLLFLDLPLSAFFLALVMLGLPDFQFKSLPFPVSDFQGFLAPAVFHSFVGSVWYYFLPRIVRQLRWVG